MNKTGLFTDFSLDLFGKDSSDPHVKIKKLTKSTERSLPWQADTFSPSQEFPHNLRKIKSHYFHHYSLLLLSTLQYANEQQVHLISVWPISISSSHLHLRHPIWFSSACFATNIPKYNPHASVHFSVYVIVIRPEDGRLKRPKHVVQEKVMNSVLSAVFCLIT